MNGWRMQFPNSNSECLTSYFLSPLGFFLYQPQSCRYLIFIVHTFIKWIFSECNEMQWYRRLWSVRKKMWKWYNVLIIKMHMIIVMMTYENNSPIIKDSWQGSPGQKKKQHNTKTQTMHVTPQRNHQDGCCKSYSWRKWNPGSKRVLLLLVDNLDF